MNINPLIISTLKPIVPIVKPNRYNGSEKIYITFNYVSDEGISYADDVPEEEEASMQIHLFCPGDYDYINLKKQIRQALYQAGFSYPRIYEFYEDDTKINHIAFECEYVKESEEFE